MKWWVDVSESADRDVGATADDERGAVSNDRATIADSNFGERADVDKFSERELFVKIASFESGRV